MALELSEIARFIADMNPAKHCKPSLTSDKDECRLDFDKDVNHVVQLTCEEASGTYVEMSYLVECDGTTFGFAHDPTCVMDICTEDEVESLVALRASDLVQSRLTDAGITNCIISDEYPFRSIVKPRVFEIQYVPQTVSPTPSPTKGLPAPNQTSRPTQSPNNSGGGDEVVPRVKSGDTDDEDSGGSIHIFQWTALSAIATGFGLVVLLC